MKSQTLFIIAGLLSALCCSSLFAAVIEAAGVSKAAGEFGNILDHPPSEPSNELPVDLMMDAQVLSNSARKAICLIVLSAFAGALSVLSLSLAGLVLHKEVGKISNREASTALVG